MEDKKPPENRDLSRYDSSPLRIFQAFGISILIVLGIILALRFVFGIKL